MPTSEHHLAAASLTYIRPVSKYARTILSSQKDHSMWGHHTILYKIIYIADTASINC
jgi:hypothetical protein